MMHSYGALEHPFSFETIQIWGKLNVFFMIFQHNFVIFLWIKHLRYIGPSYTIYDIGS